MEDPIYVLWRCKRTESWYQLSKQEAETILVKERQALKAVGGRNIISCDSRWGFAQCEWFGIDEFPNIQARQAFVAIQEELNLFRYYDVDYTLATGISLENILPQKDTGA